MKTRNIRLAFCVPISRFSIHVKKARSHQTANFNMATSEWLGLGRLKIPATDSSVAPLLCSASRSSRWSHELKHKATQILTQIETMPTTPHKAMPSPLSKRFFRLNLRKTKSRASARGVASLQMRALQLLQLCSTSSLPWDGHKPSSGTACLVGTEYGYSML